MGVVPGYVTVTDPGSFNGNPFEFAISVVDSLADPSSGFVPRELLKNRTQANEAYEQSMATIAELANISFVVPTMDILPTIDPEVPFDPTRPTFARTSFTVMPEYSVGTAPTVTGISTISPPNIPEFSPSITSIVIPNPPQQNLIQSPGTGPSTPVFTFPILDPISYPMEPQLTDVNIPAFAGITMPEFTTLYPTIDDPVINTLIEWNEPVYTREIIDSVIAKIEQMLAGGLAIDASVEQGIVDRSRDREDRLVNQLVSQATNEIAGRGFTSPPGILIDRIDNIRAEGLVKKLSLNRDVMIKVFDEELANMRLAVQSGITAEQLFVTLFLASVERLFEVQKINLSTQVQLYNLQVTVFNARMQEVQIRASVYETQVRAALAEVEIFKALIDAEKAKAEINKSLVDMYVAQIEARKIFVEIYESQVRAVAVRAEVFSIEVQAFKGRVDAYAAEIGAEKLKFDAYDSQVRGEAAKAGIIESEARAYAAHIEGIGSGVTANVASLRGEVDVIEARIQAYVASVQGISAQADIKLKAIQAEIQGFSADTQKYVADGSIIESENRVVVAAWDAANRTNIAFFEAQIVKFRTQIEALTQQANVALGALRASGDISSTITAGALAAMHLGASISAGSNVNATGNQSMSFDESRRVSNDESCTTINSSQGSWSSDQPILVQCPANYED